MNNLTMPVFKTIYKRKPAKIFMSFGLFPILIMIISFLPTNFMQIGGLDNSMSFMDFFDLCQSIVFDTVLPLVALIYLIIYSINQEIEKGTLYLYKDLDRNKIIDAKIKSIILVYVVFSLITFLAALIAYYIHFKNLNYGSGEFISSIISDRETMWISLIGKFYIYIITIVIAVFLSIRFNNGITLVVTLFFALFSSVSEKLGFSKYLFPNSYYKIYSQFGFGKAILIMTGLLIIYLAIFYTLSRKYFKKLEF